MKIEIICPLYNAEDFIKNLDKSFKMQKDIDILEISYILTQSDDATQFILDEINANYIEIEKNQFSHSLSREKIAIKSESDILVFVTQDVEIKDEYWLKKLIEPIICDEAQASFSRQLTKYNNIEKYIREKNYPDCSYVVSKKNIEEMGLKTFFFSDASSAIKTDIFKKLNGYDGKKLPTNEDMYIAYKLIINGFRIKYCSDSVVYHSHQFTLKQLYKRYYDTGLFFSQENYLDKFGTNKSGEKLAFYILERVIKEKNLKVLFRWGPDMSIRFLGMKKGKIDGKKIKII